MSLKITVKILFLDEGSFLYNPKTLDLYSCDSPHHIVGYITFVKKKMCIRLK